MEEMESTQTSEDIFVTMLNEARMLVNIQTENFKKTLMETLVEDVDTEDDCHVQ